MPKVEGLFRDEECNLSSKRVDAVLITHGHGDHIGLLPYIHPHLPVYIGKKALEIYNTTSAFIGRGKIVNPTHYFQSGREMVIGDFTITPYLIDHSGFDAYAFVIRHSDKTMVYTGDFRSHGRKKKATEYFLAHIPQNIDLLAIEGTMMSREKERVDSEEEIEEKAYRFMKNQSVPKPVLVLQSSTNIDRLVSMYRAAKRSGRIFVMDIFTAHIASKLSRRIPQPGIFDDVRVFYPYYLTKRMFQRPEGESLMKQFSRYRISRSELGQRSDYCMLIRDTMLSDLNHIMNLQGAGFIYSLWKGYKKQPKMMRVLDYAKSMGMNIIDLHTSGHAPFITLRNFIHGVKAEKVIPVHTECPNLFAKKFENVYIAKDGEIISV